MFNCTDTGAALGPGVTVWKEEEGVGFLALMGRSVFGEVQRAYQGSRGKALVLRSLGTLGQVCGLTRAHTELLFFYSTSFFLSPILNVVMFVLFSHHSISCSLHEDSWSSAVHRGSERSS